MVMVQYSIHRQLIFFFKKKMKHKPPIGKEILQPILKASLLVLVTIFKLLNQNLYHRWDFSHQIATKPCTYALSNGKSNRLVQFKQFDNEFWKSKIYWFIIRIWVNKTIKNKNPARKKPCKKRSNLCVLPANI